jgi:hypothetical protein
MWGALAAALVLGSSSSPAAQPSRIVFASSRTTVSQLYSIEASGRGLAQLTFGTRDWSAPVPSPDGRFVAASRFSELWLMRSDGRNARLVAADRGLYSWSRDSRRLVFAGAGGIWTVVAAGGLPRRVTRGQYDSAPAFSPDGRSIAFVRAESGNELVVRRHGREEIVLYDASGTPQWLPDGKSIAISAGSAPHLVLARRRSNGAWVVAEHCATCALPGGAWSPDGRRLAYADGEGIHVVERSGRGERLLAAGPTQGFAWSPRGKAIVFATTSGVRVVTLSGWLRPLVSFGLYEAQPGVGWSYARTDLDYQTPEETPLLVRVSPRELQARVPITRLSADGNRVAYWLCPHIFGAWRPGDEQSLSLGPATFLACRAQPPMSGFGNYVYDLALAGDRLAYLTGVAANRVHTALMLTTLARGDEGVEIVQAAYDYGRPPALGDVVGGGSALVYGTRESPVVVPPGPETIWRLDDTKPVQITHAPDDFQPLSADQGRIVARRADGSLELLDTDGRVLRTFEVSSLGAALAGDDLVVHVKGELRDYSASTGDLLHVWPVPDVPGAKLADAARGVVLYTLDGVVHLLRLADGADVTVPGATAAELTDAGLFYTFKGEDPWPGRIRFVPLDELPLR